MKTQLNNSITAYMGKAKSKGGRSGWIPFHPAIAQAIAPAMSQRDQNQAQLCALFLTVCIQMRGRSTMVEGDWIEKTRTDWMNALGASKRSIDFVVGFMCYDDATGQPLAVPGLGLVRRRLGGYRNSAQYLVDMKRINQFWLTNGPQPALKSGNQVAPLAGQLKRKQVAPQAGRQVAPLAGLLVAPLAGQPHQNEKKTCKENIINSGNDDGVIRQLLGIYGFTDRKVIASTAAQLSRRTDGPLQLFFNAEMALAEQVHRAGGPRPIANVIGWTWRRLQNIDDATPVMSWPAVDQTLTAALDELAAHSAGGQRRLAIGSDQADDGQARLERRAIVLEVLGVSAETPVPSNDDDARAAAALAEIERRRERRQKK